MTYHNVIIKGTGYCLPDNSIDNRAIVSKLNSTEAFIKERTGVLTRKHVDTHQSLSDITVPAMASALSDANLKASDIDMLIVNCTAIYKIGQTQKYHDCMRRGVI